MMATSLLPFSFLFLFSLLLSVSIAVPPASPVLCNSTTGACIVSNAYGVWGDRQVCSVPSVVYPTTEAELVAAVADASRHNLKLKVISGFSHSIPKLVCPSPTGSVLISTTKYAAGVSVDSARRRVVADAGVGLRDLIDKVEAAGLSLPAAPYWEGVSIAGLLSTGSHGSSWWGSGGAVHEYVAAIRLVVPTEAEEGFAKVLDVDGGNPEVFNAVRVSLGLLGVISKVTLLLQPAFKRSITYDYRADDWFQDEFTELAKRHEFFDITWYPSQGKAMYRLDDREPMNASGDGVNDYIGFQSFPTLTSMAVRAAEKSLEESKNVKGKCALASTVLAAKALVSNGLKNNNVIFTGYPVVGRQGRMQTSGSCLHSSARNPFSMCAWDPRIKGLFFYETTAMFPASKFRDFVLDVKKLRDLSPQSFCGVDIYSGFLIRFVKASDAYLGQPEDAVAVDFNYYRADEPRTPRLNQDVWEEVEQMAFFKHGARPHWGKNRKVAFIGVQHKYPNMSKFAAVKRQLDPRGLFSSEWLDEVLLGKETGKGEGCAMEGQCICSEDGHCSPSNGYLCKQGLVYREANVCRFSNSSASGITS